MLHKSRKVGGVTHSARNKDKAHELSSLVHRQSTCLQPSHLLAPFLPSACGASSCAKSSSSVPLVISHPRDRLAERVLGGGSTAISRNADA